jgi:hypothetical protein
MDGFALLILMMLTVTPLPMLMHALTAAGRVLLRAG